MNTLLTDNQPGRRRAEPKQRRAKTKSLCWPWTRDNGVNGRGSASPSPESLRQKGNGFAARRGLRPKATNSASLFDIREVSADWPATTRWASLIPEENRSRRRHYNRVYFAFPYFGFDTISTLTLLAGSDLCDRRRQLPTRIPGTTHAVACANHNSGEQPGGQQGLGSVLRRKFSL